jgi:Spy/CpxP family protein refolding chaperone
MLGKAKDLLLLLSLSLNVPFILMWAAANTTQSRAATRGESRPQEPTSTETSTPARAVNPMPRAPMPRSFNPSRSEGTRSVYREVGVTEEQWHEIEPRLAQFRATLYRLGRDMKRERDELVELVAAAELDYDAIRSKEESLLETHRKTNELITENMLADREILTADQQDKFFKKLRDYCGPSPSSIQIRSPGKYGPAFGTQQRSK